MRERDQNGSADVQQLLTQAYECEAAGNFQEALRACDTAIEISPSLAEAHNLRGIMLEELGCKTEALAAYREAVCLDSNLGDARENLSELETEIGQVAQKEESTSKPALPPVPQSVRQRAYRPSGQWSRGSLVSILGLGLPAAAVIGAVGYFVGLVFPLLVRLYIGLYALVASLCQMGNLIMGIALYLSFVLFGLLYPAALGAVTGYVMWILLRRSRCRNVKLAAASGLAGGIVGYGVLAFIIYQQFGMVQLSSQMISTYFELTSTPWWLYVLVVADAVLFIGIAALVSAMQVGQTPFCEHCEVWYGGWQQKNLPLEVAEPLLEAVSKGSAQPEETLDGIYLASEPPYLAVQVRGCPSCERSDAQLDAKVLWQETTTDKYGVEKTETKDEHWFKTMVSSEWRTWLNQVSQPPPKPAPPGVCVKCGEHNASGVRYCTVCGASLARDADH